MAHLISRRTMGLAMGVEMGAGRCAAIGVIAELVDVHAALSVSIVACDVPGDGCGGCFGGLLKGDGSGDFGIAADLCNWASVSEATSFCESKGDGGKKRTEKMDESGDAWEEEKKEFRLSIQVSNLAQSLSPTQSDPAIGRNGWKGC